MQILGAVQNLITCVMIRDSRPELMSNLVGTVKSINSTKAVNLIVECFDYQQYKKLFKTTHLGEWLIKVYVPKSMNTSIGCVYNMPLDISEEEIKDVLKFQNVSNCVRLTYFKREKKKDNPLPPSSYTSMSLNFQKKLI